MELVSEAPPPTHIPHISTTERWRFTEEQRGQTVPSFSPVFRLQLRMMMMVT